MLKKKYQLYISMLFVCAMGLSVFAAPVASPWDHGGSELSSTVTIVPGVSPLSYSSAFDREREMLGYNPRFMPNTVTFDKNNKPYIFIQVHPGETAGGNSAHFTKHEYCPEAFVQTLDDNGNWVVYDLKDVFTQAIPELVTNEFYAGLFERNRVAFDYDGGMYLTANSKYVSGKTLFYSDDQMQTLSYKNLQSSAFLEVADTFTSSERHVPSIAHNHGPLGELCLTPITKNAIGALNVGADVVMTNEFARFSPTHSGYGNSSFTVGTRTYLIWSDSEAATVDYETKQYIAYYDSITDTVSTPYFLGSTTTWDDSVAPDEHNGPAMAVDRDKNLHVILGAHATPMKYTYSTDLGETWSSPELLPGGMNAGTYPAMVVDRDNTIHVVYRNCSDAGDGYKYKLYYARKKESQPWEDLGVIVNPAHLGYSIYYHKLTVDRLGRVFLAYYYYADDMTSAEKDAYRAKWPSEPDPDVEIYAHDPAMIMTADGGDTWHIATTQDFVDGVMDTTDLAAYYTFNDAANLTNDDSGNAVTLGTDASHSGATAVTGMISGAASFDGADGGYVATLDQASKFADGAFTVSLWTKPTAVNSSELDAIVRARSGGAGFGVFILSGSYRFFTYGLDDAGSTRFEEANSQVAAVAGQWTHIAVTYEPTAAQNANGSYLGTSKIYVDGVLKATKTGKYYNPSVTAFGVAQEEDGGSAYNGVIDDLAVYSGALPAKKIAELAETTYNPINVNGEVLYAGDLNEDGTVDFNDLMLFMGVWLNQ